MAAKEKAVALANKLFRSGALSQEHYDTLLAGLKDEGEDQAETPLGTIVVKKAIDVEHPGFYIDLRMPGCASEPEDMPDVPLALIEFCRDEGDVQEGEAHIITRVWKDVREEDYSERIIHEGLAEVFGDE